ncbi:MAG: SPOR domain-containing protein, partial [Hyphomicrobiaceae bacterium]|nr:SPOR domain-containing protein [Hyphomicrobiaceae bacterium]
MTPRDLPRSQFLATVTELVAPASVVALVPLGTDEPNPDLPWEIARRVARAGRRVALVDLGLERPLLATPEEDPDEGIADALMFGASLQRVAAEQDVKGLFYVGVGTPPANAADVWSHERWRRLARGFANEGALLLLALPPEGLEHLGVEPDWVVGLATGERGDSASHPALEARRAAGKSVTLVLSDAAPAAASRPTPRRAGRPVATRRVRPRRRRRWVLAGIAAAGATAAGALLFLPGEGSGSAPAPASAPFTPAVTANAATTAVPDDDSLYYAVQVAAFASMENALERGRDFERAGWTVTVTSVRLGGQGTWHRLLVGALPDPAEAGRALTRLWRSGLVDQPNGTILRTPHTIQVPGAEDSAAAAQTL